MSKKVIVFAPHPDDETFGCGGTIAKRVREEYEVIVVVLTDGRHAFSRVLDIWSDPSPEEMKAIREEELKSAMKVLGVSERNLIFLGFEDGCLHKHEEEVKTKIAQILSENTPKEVYFPHKRDAHPDHRAAHRIVKTCMRELGVTCAAYQYSIVSKYSRVGPILENLRNLVTRSRLTVDISPYISIKERASSEFRSEIAVTSPKQTRPPFGNIEKYFRSHEVFYKDK